VVEIRNNNFTWEDGEAKTLARFLHHIPLKTFNYMLYPFYNNFVCRTLPKMDVVARKIDLCGKLQEVFSLYSLGSWELPSILSNFFPWFHFFYGLISNRKSMIFFLQGMPHPKIPSTCVRKLSEACNRG
jgi:hypothetical protein